jgi:hypothetical protein
MARDLPTFPTSARTRNHRFDVLAGMTPGAEELRQARAGLRRALDAYRGRIPSFRPVEMQRDDVRKAIARLRGVEAALEARWGAW